MQREPSKSSSTMLHIVALIAMLLSHTFVASGFTSRIVDFPVTRCRRSRLAMFNIFSSFDDFLNRMNKNNGDDKAKPYASDDLGESTLAAGTSRLVRIPVTGMKPGGLRLFIMFYLMGMQNTPDKKSWKAHQPSTEEFVVDFWYHDQTAVLSIELAKDMVTIDRVGSSPSMQYLVQETIIINGILDELQTCANEPSVPEADRLIVLKDADAIEKARESLSFG